jgi:hypothetical protein
MQKHFATYELKVLHYELLNVNVVTLTLGSRPKQGLAKVQAKSEARESHFMFPGV